VGHLVGRTLKKIFEEQLAFFLFLIHIGERERRGPLLEYKRIHVINDVGVTIKIKFLYLCLRISV
jgi:hypothetical protein